MGECGDREERVMVKEDCINYYPPGRDDEYCMAKDDVFLHCEECEKYKSKYTKTNADKIRSMSDEELADYLRWHNDLYSRNGMDWLDWLRQEATDGKS